MAKPAIPTPTAATQYPGGSATSGCPLPVDHLNITTGSDSTDAAENCHVVSDSVSEPSSKRFATIV